MLRAEAGTQGRADPHGISRAESAPSRVDSTPEDAQDTELLRDTEEGLNSPKGRPAHARRTSTREVPLRCWFFSPPASLHHWGDGPRLECPGCPVWQWFVFVFVAGTALCAVKLGVTEILRGMRSAFPYGHHCVHHLVVSHLLRQFFLGARLVTAAVDVYFYAVKGSSHEYLRWHGYLCILCYAARL